MRERNTVKLSRVEFDKEFSNLKRLEKADIVIAHRPWDYHPDHRYVGVLVQDALFMVWFTAKCGRTQKAISVFRQIGQA